MAKNKPSKQPAKPYTGEQIHAAASELAHDNDAHWTTDGKPAVAAIADKLGIEPSALTREIVDDATDIRRNPADDGEQPPEPTPPNYASVAVAPGVAFSEMPGPEHARGVAFSLPNERNEDAPSQLLAGSDTPEIRVAVDGRRVFVQISLLNDNGTLYTRRVAVNEDGGLEVKVDDRAPQ